MSACLRLGLFAAAAFAAVVLSAAVLHADPEVAREAVALAMRLSEDAAKDFLVGCLCHDAWIVRIAAIEALLTRRLAVLPGMIEDLLRTESEALVRAALLRLLKLAEAGA